MVDEREDGREEEEERVKDEELKTDEVEEVELMEVQLETDGGEEQMSDKDQNEDTYTLLLPPALPLLRATSLQDQPANQSQESSAALLPRSLSLERQPSFTDTCDG